MITTTTPDPHLVLAPMEGLADARIRQVLTALGGFDLCVTEFIRVSQTVLPPKVFYRKCPELLTGGRTASGTPVLVQFMGHDPQIMAENAVQAVELGALGIDINFGCPSKVVNRREAGASLLKCPDNLFNIVSAVRKAVPDHIPVSAKMRLGYADKNLFLENAQAAASGGAAHLTVHARTKVEGYKPPAHWEYIARIREAVDCPVTANGEIWTREDYHRCREVSGCTSFMLGRGALARPGLATWIKTGSNPVDWNDIRGMFRTYAALMEAGGVEAKMQPGRIKQWNHLLKNGYPEAGPHFDRIKRLTDMDALLAA